MVLKLDVCLMPRKSMTLPTGFFCETTAYSHLKFGSGPTSLCLAICIPKNTTAGILWLGLQGDSRVLLNFCQ